MDDWYYITTSVIETERTRESPVLDSSGKPFVLERKKQPIGFILKGKKDAD